MIFWYHKIIFFYIGNSCIFYIRSWFSDLRNDFSISENNFLILENNFLISENQFLILEKIFSDTRKIVHVHEEYWVFMSSQYMVEKPSAQL